MKSTSSILALSFLIAAIVLYSMVFSPMSASLSKARVELSAETAKHVEITSSIRQRDELKKKIDGLIEESAQYRTTLIEPMLNSYSMRVKSFLDTMAHEAGLLNVEYEEGELRALPVPKEQLPDLRTARRSVKIRALGDYAAIVSFLLRAEHELPLMTLQSISITKSSQSVSAEIQNVIMDVEWPCEGEVFK